VYASSPQPLLPGRAGPVHCRRMASVAGPRGFPIARAFVLLLASLSFVGCARSSAIDAGTAQPEAAVRAVDDDRAAPARADKPEAGGRQGAETGGQSADAGSPSESGGPGFGGTYSCFATMVKRNPSRFRLKLTRAGATVAGESSTRAASMTLSFDMSCRVTRDTCSGRIHRFTSTNGGHPDPTGQGKVTLRMADGGIEYFVDYSEPPTGDRGFCSRQLE